MDGCLGIDHGGGSDNRGMLISKPSAAHNQGTLDTYMSASQVYGGITGISAVVGSLDQSRSPSAPSKPSATQSTLTAFAVPRLVSQQQQSSVSANLAPPTLTSSCAPAIANVKAAASLGQSSADPNSLSSGNLKVASNMSEQDPAGKFQQSIASADPAIAYGARCYASTGDPILNPQNLIAQSHSLRYPHDVTPTPFQGISTVIRPPSTQINPTPSVDQHSMLTKTNSTSVFEPLVSTSAIGIPPEVLSRIEANRLEAIERRKRRAQLAAGDVGAGNAPPQLALTHPSTEHVYQRFASSFSSTDTTTHLNPSHIREASSSSIDEYRSHNDSMRTTRQHNFRTGGGIAVSVSDDSLRKADNVLQLKAYIPNAGVDMTSIRQQSVAQSSHAASINPMTYSSIAAISSVATGIVKDGKKIDVQINSDAVNDCDGGRKAQQQEHIALMAARSTSALPANFGKFTKGNRKSERSID